MTREILHQRRQCQTFQIMHGNLRAPFVVSVGLYPDGRPAECFVDGGKAGTETQVLSRDGAVLLSLALQHGCPLETIRHAITRNPDNSPSSLLGAIVDSIAREVGQ